MSKLSKFANINNDTYLLIGAPNVGKSTIFNLITHSTTLVSNIDRMTTEHTIGKIKKFNSYLIDLPGTYNLSHPIDEEEETHYHLLHHKVNAIVNVIASFSLQRDLFLTLQCIETGLLNTLCINMIDLINCHSLDWKILSKKLNNIKIILTRSNRKKNVNQIVESIHNSQNVNPHIITYSNEIEQWIKKIEEILPKMHISKRFAAIMLLENNQYFINELQKSYPNFWNNIKTIWEKTQPKNFIVQIRDAKYNYIKKILKLANYDNNKFLKINIEKQNNFDFWFLKPWIGIPIFLCITILIYYLAFGAGGYIQTSFSNELNNIINIWFKNQISNCNEWVKSLLIDGVLKGLFIIVAFLPSLIILYICITIIQQIGLLSRVSILLDNVLDRFGISGRSVVNLLTAFGCNVPALMLTRSSSSKKERIISILIIPFIPCATKIIVISAICQQVLCLSFSWLFIFGLVILSGSIALTFGLALSKTFFRKEKSFFCVEMVHWNGIDLRVIIKSLWEIIKNFLKKVTLVITIANLVVWLLLHIGTTGYIGPHDPLDRSILGYIGKGLSYITYPIFYNTNWQLPTSLISGILAKEAIYSTLLQLANGQDIKILFGNNYIPCAISFIIFSLYYLPCISTIAIMTKDIKWKKTFMYIGFCFLLSYLLAMLSYGLCFAFAH